ncbi:unnamed protein product [Cuscuta campestris]|uniref:Uncharacterized protein n=1 Tax=Cuscuta campestris TaxID=132261 RepID=A0A484L2V8_9ASTE|nr:unnamed protein product [Cuscuta campestris]
MSSALPLYSSISVAISALISVSKSITARANLHCRLYSSSQSPLYAHEHLIHHRLLRPLHHLPVLHNHLLRVPCLNGPSCPRAFSSLQGFFLTSSFVWYSTTIDVQLVQSDKLQRPLYESSINDTSSIEEEPTPTKPG